MNVTNYSWQNWSGSIVAQPTEIHAPTDEASLIALVRKAHGDKVLRVVGSGHSFVPLCTTEGILITLDDMQDVVSSEVEQRSAVVRAGTKLYQLGPALHAVGLAMENLGDIDRQSLAGAISTGTHGTGQTLRNISSQVSALRLVTASGDIIECSTEQETEIFKAAQVSLGALGVISTVTLRLRPAYRLRERTWILPYAACMAALPDLTAANRHCEFFWAPREDACAMKTLNETELTTLPEQPAPTVTGRLARYLNPERIDWSYRILPSERTVKFNEMEYAVPAEHGPECMDELRAMMQSRHPDVVWPIEYRTLAADDIYLSPAYGRATVTLSVHQAAELAHQELFADAEAIFRNHAGCPHWGKCHTATPDMLEQRYPYWNKFLSLRDALDPQRKFVNAYLENLFGLG